MAQFTAKRLDESKINGGNRYNVGDGVSEEAINAPIEGVLYAQNFLDAALEKSQVALDGFYQVKEKQSEQDKKIEENSQHVKVLYNIVKQKEFIDVTKVEQAYTSRETAAGQNIVDEQDTDVLEIRGSTVKCENLIPYPYKDFNENLVQFPQTTNSVEFTNENGVITVNGTNDKSNASVWFPLSPYIKVTKGASYYVSGCPVGGGVNKYGILVNIYNSEEKSVGEVYEYGNGLVYTPQEGEEKIVVYIRVYPSGTVNNAKFKPLFKIGTNGQWQPYFTGLKHAYIDSIKSTGRNLIPYHNDYDCGSSGSQDGIDYTVNADGSITLNGTVTADHTVIWLRYDIHAVELEVGKTYRVNALGIEGVHFVVQSNDYSSYIKAEGTVATYPRYMVYLAIYSGATLNNTTIYPMLYAGTKEKPFEPYTEDIYQLPETLELGEWDSFNPETGELVKGTKTIVFDGTKEWYKGENDYGVYFACYRAGFYSTPIISNKFRGGHPESGTPCGYMLPDSALVVFPNADKNNPTITTVEEWKAQIAGWHASGNPLTVAYKSATPTTETIANVPKGYKVHNHGSESVVQGATDNSKYGAMPTITNEYMIIL